MSDEPRPAGAASADDGWSYRGLKTVILENAHLRVMVLADKGGDIASLVHKPSDTEYLWRSPGWVRDPRTHSPMSSQSDQTWLDTYEGGWQSIFPNGGWTSSYGELDLPLHAESAVLPWAATVVDPGPDTAVVELATTLVRTPLAARRRLTLHRDSPTLAVTEEITNLAPEPFPVSYGQHIVFGPPFLSPACRVDLPGGSVHVHPEPDSPANSLAPGARSTWPDVTRTDGSTRDLRWVPGPDAASVDQLYLGDLAAGWYAVTNTELGVGLAVRFPRDLYRYVWQWEVFGGHYSYPWWGRTYSLGLEPFTSATNKGLAQAIDDGSAVWIEPGRPLVSTVHVTAYRSEHGVVNVDDRGAVTVRAEAEAAPGGGTA